MSENKRAETWPSATERPQPANDIEALQQAILEDARADVQHVLEEAKARARDIRAATRAEAEEREAVIVERAQHEAETLQSQAVAAARMDAQSLKLRHREDLLSQVFAHARQRLETITQRQDYELVARQFVREAIQHLGPGEFVVRADPATQEVLTQDVLDDIAHVMEAELKPGPPLTDRLGVIVETADEHRRYDNTLETRLSRQQDVLRTPVYRTLTGGHA